MHGLLDITRPGAGPSPIALDRTAAVRERLDRVTDPELDESVVAMGFITSIEIVGAAVSVDFRLPTFWCAANFAFLMAEDMRIAVESLPWVSQASVRLNDHFAADRINRGIADGLPFEQVFADEATGGLDAIRATFAEKAFLGRQSALLDRLIARDGEAAALALSIDGLCALVNNRDEAMAASAARYLAIRRHHGGTPVGALAFTTPDGRPLSAVDVPAYRRMARRVLRTARGNAEFCRMYIDARVRGTNLEALEQNHERRNR